MFFVYAFDGWCMADMFVYAQKQLTMSPDRAFVQFVGNCIAFIMVQYWLTLSHGHQGSVVIQEINSLDNINNHI